MLRGLYFYLYWIILFFCIYNYFINRRHLLCILLRLEFFILIIYYILCLRLVFYRNEFFMRFYYLTIIVCEGGLGLSLLVSLIHSHGNELVNSFILNI